MRRISDSDDRMAGWPANHPIVGSVSGDTVEPDGLPAADLATAFGVGVEDCVGDPTTGVLRTTAEVEYTGGVGAGRDAVPVTG